MVRNVAHADAETITLDRALNGAAQSLGSRRDPISRAAAAAQVAERLNRALATVAECRSRAVAEATLLPGLSMAKVADELGLAKSTVAKLAGPADFRQGIAADMRTKLEAAFEVGADEGRRRR
jgi:molecular chaperone DnaK (HSP70)